MIPRILVMAGEPSGDLHAAAVVTALRAAWPEVIIDAVGGPHLEAAGANLIRSLDGLAAMGFVEIVHALPAHIGLLRRLNRDFRAGRWQLVITVDYPGFHLRVAESARRAGIPVLGYIAPQLWAWRPSRARRWSRAVDQMAVILPFEPDFLAIHGLQATYVGHPLVDRPVAPSREEARERLGIASTDRVLALFPGSRRGEIHRIWPVYRDAAELLRQRNQVERIIVAGTAWGRYERINEADLHRDDPALVLAAADAVLAKSGTTTLEAALADVPMVVAYRTHPLTFQVARRLVTVPWISLVNLIAEREVVPELWQDAANAAELARRIAPLLDRESSERRLQLDGLGEVRTRLGGPGASERVARLARELVES